MEHKYFERELPSNYKEVKHIDATNAKFGLIFNLIAMAVLVVVMAIAFLILHLDNVIVVFDIMDNFGVFVITMIVLVVYIVLHELVHGIAYKALTKEKLTFGLSWSCAFCGVPNLYVYKKASLIALLAPFITFTVIFIPLMIVLYFINPLYFLASAFVFGMHVGGCSGDLYVTFLLTIKYKGKNVLIKDTGPAQSFYLPEDEIK